MNKTRCAWCEQENGWERAPGVSHGICAMHAARELNEVKRAQIEREVRALERDMEKRTLRVEWSEEEQEGPWSRGKRPDQVRYSLVVVIVAAIIAVGYVVGAIVSGFEGGVL